MFAFKKNINSLFVLTYMLLNSIDSNINRCYLCTERFGVCTCTSTECVRIFGTRTVREIKVFRCGVKIMRASEWSGQDPIIRDRNNNICIGEYFL